MDERDVRLAFSDLAAYKRWRAVGVSKRVSVLEVMSMFPWIYDMLRRLDEDEDDEDDAKRFAAQGPVARRARRIKWVAAKIEDKEKRQDSRGLPALLALLALLRAEANAYRRCDRYRISPASGIFLRVLVRRVE